LKLEECIVLTNREIMVLSGGATTNSNSRISVYGDILSAMLHCQHTLDHGQ